MIINKNEMWDFIMFIKDHLRHGNRMLTTGKTDLWGSLNSGFIVGSSKWHGGHNKAGGPIPQISNQVWNEHRDLQSHILTLSCLRYSSFTFLWLHVLQIATLKTWLSHYQSLSSNITLDHCSVTALDFSVQTDTITWILCTNTNRNISQSNVILCI